MSKDEKKKDKRKTKMKLGEHEQHRPHEKRPLQDDGFRPATNQHVKLPERTIRGTYRYQEISDINDCFQKTRSALEDGSNSASKSAIIQSSSHKPSMLYFLICGTKKMSPTDNYSYRTADVKNDPVKLLEKLGSLQGTRGKVLVKLGSGYQPDRLKEFLDVDNQCQDIRMSLTEMIRSALDNGEDALRKLHERIINTEEEFKKERSSLTERIEELTLFKDRVAGDVASSIKTGTTVNLNNPVSKPRLIELYDDLRRRWPKIKSNLKSRQENPDRTRKVIQTQFKKAKTDMLEKKWKIDDIFGLNKTKTEAPASKVRECRKLTIQNLQMAIYSDKQWGLKDPTQVTMLETLKDVINDLEIECYRLGCLMALNDPPLEPDWNDPPETCDKWDILPKNITESVKNQEKITSVYL